jgi:hypothetical protein
VGVFQARQGLEEGACLGPQPPQRLRMHLSASATFGIEGGHALDDAPQLLIDLDVQHALGVMFQSRSPFAQANASK